MPTAIGYIRVSTLEQATEGVSLAAQRARIEAYCVANDYPLAAIFTDAGLSGASMKNRDGLHDALKAATKGTVLVAYGISRLARSTRDMLAIGDRLEKQGADLVSLTEKIDTTTAAGRMVFRMLAVLSEFERDQISERTTAALRHKRLKGEKYAPVPFGYQAIEGRLIEVQEEARIVRDILKLREEGATLRAIADQLNVKQIQPKKGGRTWYASTVRYILKRQAAA